MKYRILPFIIGVMLAGCNAKYGSAGQTVTENDSIPKSTKAVSLIDSVHDDNFKKLLADDSIELIQVNHAMCDSPRAVEQIAYIDYHVDTFYLDWYRSNDTSIINGIREGNLRIPDSVPHTTVNPNPALYGSYITVQKYHDRYYYFDNMDMCQEIITDTAIWEVCEGLYDYTYIAVKSDNGITTFSLLSMGVPETLQIKKIGGPYDMQVWKWIEQTGVRYELRIPLLKAPVLPWIKITNNCNPEMTVELPYFDPINYDSLMNSK